MKTLYSKCMRYFILVIVLHLAYNDLSAGTMKDSTWGYLISNTVSDKYQASNEVRLTGLLNEHVIINMEKRLLRIDSAILLAGFVQRPGSQSWIGEHVGKFLFSAANSYRYSRDKRMKDLMDEMVRKYIATQLPDGYLGTYLPEQYWKSWDVWAHKYAIIGLINYYSVTGHQKALETAKRAADLICRVFGDRPGQLDLNKSGYQNGMASGSILEPMIDLYRYTGDSKYLSFARYILKNWETETGPKIISSLEKYGKVTKVGNAKAYEMMSCFIGILKYYRLTGEQGLLAPMKTAWDDIVANKLYITGTASSDEVFKADHQLPADSISQMGEGCVTTTWIQYNEQLLNITGEHKYIDEIEKTIYNHLLAAQNPVSGCVSFYTLLQGPKQYKCDDGMSCCLSSISRGISLIPGMVWGQIGGSFSVLLYEPGKVKDSIVAADGSKLVLQVTALSDFPLTGNIKYMVNAGRSKKFSINFRVPSWAQEFTVVVNGVQQKNTIKGQFFSVDRVWGKKDEVFVSFKMPLQVIDGAPSYQGSIAFKRGPQVLSLDAALNPGFTDTPGFTFDRQSAFIISSDHKLLPGNWIGKQAYQINREKGKKEALFVLVPFSDAGQQSTIQKVWIPYINNINN